MQRNFYPAPSAPLPPPPYYQGSRGERINRLLEQHEIDILFGEKLSILEDFEIVLLLDDSGSMNSPLSDGGKHATRWDELKSVVNIVIDIATIFDNSGVDIYFLNRRSLLNVKQFSYLDSILNQLPNGRTPLTSKCQEIFDNYHNCSKNVLLVIATDGIPTDPSGNQDTKNFKKCLLEKNHSKFYVSFLACSDQDEDVAYLNKLDKKVPNVDTLDDYLSELKEVKSAQGKHFKYSLGDHICRLLLGPICPELDSLDEKKIKKTCVIL